MENGKSESVSLNKDEIYYIFSDNPITDFSFKDAIVETQFIEQNNSLYTFLKKKPTGKIITSEGQITFLSEKNIGGTLHSESELLRYHGIIDSFWYQTLEIILTITFLSTFTLGILWLIYRKNKKMVIYRVKTVKR